MFFQEVDSFFEGLVCGTTPAGRTTPFSSTLQRIAQHAPPALTCHPMLYTTTTTTGRNPARLSDTPTASPAQGHREPEPRRCHRQQREEHRGASLAFKPQRQAERERVLRPAIRPTKRPERSATPRRRRSDGIGRGRRRVEGAGVDGRGRG